jgi:hypothetical protein
VSHKEVIAAFLAWRPEELPPPRGRVTARSHANGSQEDEEEIDQEGRQEEVTAAGLSCLGQFGRHGLLVTTRKAGSGRQWGAAAAGL